MKFGDQELPPIIKKSSKENELTSMIKPTSTPKSCIGANDHYRKMNKNYKRNPTNRPSYWKDRFCSMDLKSSDCIDKVVKDLESLPKSKKKRVRNKTKHLIKIRNEKKKIVNDERIANRTDNEIQRDKDTEDFNTTVRNYNYLRLIENIFGDVPHRMPSFPVI